MMKEWPPLTWEFSDCGEWSAPSILRDCDNDPVFQYRIQVCADGTYSVNQSDMQLKISGTRCLKTLAAAKEICQIRENTVIACMIADEARGQ